MYAYLDHYKVICYLCQLVKDLSLNWSNNDEGTYKGHSHERSEYLVVVNAITFSVVVRNSACTTFRIRASTSSLELVHAQNRANLGVKSSILGQIFGRTKLNQTTLRLDSIQR